MDRVEMIDLLTGVKASKRSYYTELKKTVTELQKKNMQLEIINEVTKSFNVNMSIDEMLKNILEKLRGIFLIESLNLAAVVNGNELRLLNGYSNLTVPTRKENSLFQLVLESGKPVIKTFFDESDGEDFVESAQFKKAGIQSVLLYPLIFKGEIIGVLSFETKVKIAYEMEDYTFFQQLSDQFAVYLENVRLYKTVLKSKKEWEETFRTAPSMIFVLDLQGNITLCNEAVKVFFGVEDESVLEMTLDSFLAIEHCESPITESFQLKQATYRQYTFHNRICEMYAYPSLNELNEITSMIVYMNDVTEKRRIEAQLMHSGKLAALGEMAAGVAHELNNPLTAVLGNAQLLLRTLEAESPEYKLLTDIHHCGTRCKHIISSLLTFSRQDEYMFQECSVNQAVYQVLDLIRYQIEKQNITIELKLDNELPSINGSLQQLEQIAINLLINAKQALEESNNNHKKIKIETFLYENNDVCLRITDNGIGIKSDILEEIFNPFFTTKKAVKGTGLGLSVSLGIAKAHGGRIKVESELGEGSIFTLLIPKKDQNG